MSTIFIQSHILKMLIPLSQRFFNVYLEGFQILNISALFYEM